MKHIKKRWLGVAIAPALLALMSVAQPAYATDYSYSCANVPASVDGNVSISDENACVINHSVTATGSITVSSSNSSVTAQGLTATEGAVLVTAPTGITMTGAISSHLNTILSGSTVTADDITSDWGVQITATDGSITVADVVSNNDNSSNGGNILMHATGDIGTGNLKNNGTSTSGGIEIHANEIGTSTVFNIGGGGSNGTGTLDVRSTTGGGTANNSIRGGIWISNGSSGSTGGITVSSMSDILLTASASRSAILFLDAKAGTLALPAGTLSSDGAASSGAGFIALLANSIDTATGAIVTASQGSSVAGTYHGVLIAATTINTAGSSGLEIHADGNGVTGVSNSAALGLVPEGSVTFTSTDVLNALYWSTSVSNFLTTRGTVEITGGGSFKATANGNYSQLAVSGAPVMFANDGDATLEARGDVDHNIKLGFYGTLTGGEDFTVSGSGNTKIDASGVSGAGGLVQIRANTTAISSAAYSVLANGPSSGNGDGGKLELDFISFAQGSATTGLISANAALGGTGDARSDAISFRTYSGTVKIGTEAGQTAFSAKGGGSSGDGGKVNIESNSDAVVISGKTGGVPIVDVSAPGTTGDGGIIYIFANAGITATGVAPAMSADSGTVEGDGGKITLDVSGALLVLGTGGTSDAMLSAKSLADGKGGTVDITGVLGITVNSANIKVDGAADGKGGSILLKAPAQELTISGEFKANGGSGNGEGGVVTMEAGSLVLPNTSNTHIVANGSGDGKGGMLTLTIDGDINIANGNGTVSLEARNVDPADNNLGGNANGGTIKLTSGAVIDVYGAAIGVGGGLKGGSMNLVAANQIAISGELYADGGPQGDGGDISLTADSIALPADIDTLVSANGNGSGRGGSVTLETRVQAITIGGGNRSFEIQAMSNGSGAGGFVFVNSAAKIDALGSAINVSAGTAEVGTESGGLISFKNLVGDISLTGVFQAKGGTGGNGGTIEIGAEKDIKLADETRLFANGSASGDGGAISLQAGFLNSSTSGTIVYATENIEIDTSSGLAGGKAGNTLFNYLDSAGATYLDIRGPVKSDGVDAGGVISFTNKFNVAGVKIKTQILSATKGSISVTSALTGLRSYIESTSPSGVPGPFFGSFAFTGNSLTLKVNGTAELILGDIETVDELFIETDDGDIKSDSGTKVVTDTTVNLKSEMGKIGTGYLSPVIVKAAKVNFDFGTTPASVTAIYLNAIGDIEIGTCSTAKQVYLNSTGSMLLSDDVRTSDGQIEIESGSQITLDEAKTIEAIEGSIRLRGTTKIEFKENSFLHATTGSTDEELGNVFVSLGVTTSGATSPTPANVVISGDITNTFFGALGITASAPDNFVAALHGRRIGLDTLILPSTQIHLGGGVVIVADGP
ncbi:MAG: hypothetical protein WC028_28435 [Candidatus Obscuribacterales bacterium]|jgi:hypothetical protein